MLWDTDAKLCTLLSVFTGCVMILLTGYWWISFETAAAMWVMLRLLVFQRHVHRIIIVGPACSGKDHLRNAFKRYYGSMDPIDVSVTTRQPRPGEEPGYTYEYISKKVFDDMCDQGAMYESVRFGDNCYGTLLASWIERKIFIMSPDGVVNNIKHEDRSSCYVVYLDPPENVLMERWTTRDIPLSEQRKRMDLDNMKFKDFMDYDYHVTDPCFDAHQLVVELDTMLKAKTD